MWIYWLICAITIVISYIGSICIIKVNGYEIKNDSTKILFTSLPLIIIASIRYGIGSDYFNYEKFFNLINNGYDRFELLFTWMNRGIHFLGLNFQAFIVITSIAFTLLVILSIYHDSPNVAYSIFLLFAMGFFFQSLNIIRQMLACAICLYSIKYVEEKKPIRFIICIVLAIGFHSASIIFAPVYLFFNIKIDLKKVISILIAVFLLQWKIVDIVVEYGKGVLNYQDYFRNLNADANVGYVSLIINILIYIFAYVFIDKENKSERGFLNLQLIALALSLLNGQIPLLNRLRFYYALPGIILIPIAINNVKNKSLRTWLYVIIGVLFFAYCMYIEGYMNQSATFPYMTIFDQ